MRVDQAMSATTGSIRAADTVRRAAQKMRDLGVGCLTVEDDDHEVAGVITDRDIALHVAGDGNPASDLISQIIVGQRLVTVDPDVDLDFALMTMMTARVRRLPVVAEGHLLGIISAADLAAEGIADAALDAATPR